MQIINSSTFQLWERFYRANFINSLTGFKSVCLIGTVNQDGNPNLAIFSSIVHIGSNPALVGFINRPVEAAPHTQNTGSYTINHVHASFLEKAHQTSAKYPEGISEFDETDLTPVFQESIKAPFVKESSVKYALKLSEIIPIKLNNTFLVIGEVIHVMLTDDIILSDGFLTLDKSGSVSSNGIDGYYSTQLIGRFEYAKPNVKLEKLNNTD